MDGGSSDDDNANTCQKNYIYLCGIGIPQDGDTMPFCVL